MTFPLSITTAQLNTLIYLLAHCCYDASMVFFFSRTLASRFFVKKPFLCSLPFLGILLVYTAITGEAQSPFFKLIFYCAALAANVILYAAPFWQRLGNYFFILICLGIVEFAVSLLYYLLAYLFCGRTHFESTLAIPQDKLREFLIFIGLPIIVQILLMPFFIRLWKKASRFVNLKILIQLILATCLSGSGILYIFPQYLGQAGWIFVFLGILFSILLFFRGVWQTRMLFHLHRKEKEIFHENLKNYRTMQEKNLRLRQQNHDIADHLQTISYLLAEGKVNEAQKYIHELLKIL